MKKNFKRLFALMFAFLMVFSLCGMNYVQALPKTPATVNAAAYAKTYNLSVGKTVRLNATSRTTWETSDKTVATVSTAGVVRAMAPGTAVITAKSSRNTTQYQINVTAPVLSETSLSLSRGETHRLTVTSQATIGAISWSTSNKKVATVSSYGVVTAKGNGTAVITAKIDGFRYNCNVTVADKPVASYSEISSRTLKNYTNMISAYLEDNDMELVEVVKAADVTVRNQNGPFTATLKDVDISKISEATKLFHIKGTSVEELDFVLNGTNVEFTSDTFSPFILANVKAADDGGYVVVTPVENNTDCNFAFMEKTWFDEPDAFIKGLGSTLQGYMITYRDADGNVIVPDGPRTVTIENVDMDAFESEDEIVLAYTYIDPNVWDGNDNGVMYMNSVPYEYDAVNHRVTFEFNEFQPYYGNIMICQGGHRDLVVDEPHGPLTWSVNSNCPWGDVLVDQNGRVEVWGSFDNVEVTATDGNKTWIWLINGASNDIINLHPVVNVGETFYCYGYDDMRAGMYISSEIRSDGRVDYYNECGAIKDNGDGTATALKPGVYNLTVGFKYFLGQEGFAMQMGTITILGEEPDGFTATPLTDEQLAAAKEAVNAYLANENKQIDTVQYAADITPNGTNSIDIEGLSIPEGAVLYHVGEDGTVTPVEYTIVDGILHFEFNDFSPFLLVTTKSNINEAFLGKWYAQGTNILWEVTVYDDGTFFNHYPNYSVGDMTYTWKLADDGDTLVLFEDNFSFDENGNLVDKAWNAQGIHYAQRILSRIPNIMGWWRSADSFIEGETYPDGEHGIGFYLNEHDYCKEFNFDGEGNLEFINSDSADTYKYDVDTDTIVVTHDDGSQTILNRWYDDTLQ